MKQFLGIKILVLTLTLLAGSVATNAIERPFSINGGGLAVPILNEAGQPIGINVTGSGNGTHIPSRQSEPSTTNSIHVTVFSSSHGLTD